MQLSEGSQCKCRQVKCFWCLCCGVKNNILVEKYTVRRALYGDGDSTLKNFFFSNEGPLHRRLYPHQWPTISCGEETQRRCKCKSCFCIFTISALEDLKISSNNTNVFFTILVISMGIVVSLMMMTILKDWKMVAQGISYDIMMLMTIIKDWKLVVQGITVSDSGEYQCQVIFCDFHKGCFYKDLNRTAETTNLSLDNIGLKLKIPSISEFQIQANAVEFCILC